MPVNSQELRNDSNLEWMRWREYFHDGYSRVEELLQFLAFLDEIEAKPFSIVELNKLRYFKIALAEPALRTRVSELVHQLICEEKFPQLREMQAFVLLLSNWNTLSPEQRIFLQKEYTTPIVYDDFTVIPNLGIPTSSTGWTCGEMEEKMMSSHRHVLIGKRLSLKRSGTKATITDSIIVAKNGAILIPYMWYGPDQHFLEHLTQLQLPKTVSYLDKASAFPKLGLQVMRNSPITLNDEGWHPTSNMRMINHFRNPETGLSKLLDRDAIEKAVLKNPSLGQLVIDSFVTKLCKHPLLTEETLLHRKVGRDFLEKTLSEKGFSPDQYIAIPVGSTLWTTSEQSDHDFLMIWLTERIPYELELPKTPHIDFQQQTTYIDLLENEWQIEPFLHLFLVPDELLIGNIPRARKLRKILLSMMVVRENDATWVIEPSQWDFYISNRVENIKSWGTSHEKRIERYQQALRARADQSRNPDYVSDWEHKLRMLRTPTLRTFLMAMTFGDGSIHLRPQRLDIIRPQREINNIP